MATLVHEIICATTASQKGRRRVSGIRCLRKPAGQRCVGRLIVAENNSGCIEWECPSCGRGGTISGWQGSFSNLSDIQDFGDIPRFEIFLAEEDYDQIKKLLTMDPEADLVLHGATSGGGGIVLSGTAIDLGAFAECLTFHLRDVKTARRRKVSERVLEAVQIVLGKCSSN